MRAVPHSTTRVAYLAVLACLATFKIPARAAEPPSELLSAPGFIPLPDPKNTDGPWLPFEGGYAVAAGGGPEARNAVSMTRTADAPAMGIRQNVVLNQKQASPLRVSAWSKAINVSGVPDGDYSLYCDVTYADGTNSWGECAPFRTGSHDWDLVDFSLTPTKPIQSLTVYGLFRVHTGQVWFSGISLKGTAPMKVAMKIPADSRSLKVIPVAQQSGQPYRAKIPSRDAAMEVVVPKIQNLFQNPALTGQGGGNPTGWTAWGGGVKVDPTLPGSVKAERVNGGPEMGLMQEINLHQKTPQTVIFSGWSKAAEVSGTADSDYSLYADITFTDGSEAWGENAPFRTGTGDWTKAELVLVPPKPIRSLRAYALFRNHTGTVWFRHLEVGPRQKMAGTADWDGLAVKLPRAGTGTKSRVNAGMSRVTRDGLQLDLDKQSGRVRTLRVSGRGVALGGAPSGFMARDVANDSDFLALDGAGAKALGLKLNFEVQPGENALNFKGTLSDVTGRDRAVSLVFALPVDGKGWMWSNDVRAAKTIEMGTEYSNTIGIGSGANGRQSLYPLATIHQNSGALPLGLAIFADPEFAAQYRLAYNSGTGQLYAIFDFGLTPEKPSTEFQFGLMRFDAKWGFRGALEKLYRLYPRAFQVREATQHQGLWMPFTDLRKIKGWADFGFRFREAEAAATKDGSSAFDRQNGVLSLRYCEPSTWWMNMPRETPRTYEAAVEQLERTANDPSDQHHEEARAVITSGMRDENGRLSLRFLDAPWASGAVWGLNPSPSLTGRVTEAKLKSPDLVGELSVFHGQYLDSMEGYVTADLNYDRSQFKLSRVPLTFSPGTYRPALHKALSMWEFANWSRERLHRNGQVLMANSVPHRYGFLMPQLDVAGTETNWNSDGNYRPDSDAAMNLRRAWSGQKPYLLLQNTDFRRFDGEMMRRYMERCLFYGIFPSCFSADAATDPYWLNPKLYDRDRPTFKKYVPLVRLAAEAGWQPVTLARCPDSAVWIERWGVPGQKPFFLTVRNDAKKAKTAELRLDPAVAKNVKSVKELTHEAPVKLGNGILTLSLQPDETLLLQLN